MNTRRIHSKATRPSAVNSRSRHLRPFILATVIAPVALIVPPVNGADLILNAAAGNSPLNFDPDVAPPIFQAGLKEGVLVNTDAFNPNNYNPNGVAFETFLQNAPTLGTTLGNSNIGNGNSTTTPLNQWGRDRIFAYKGQIFTGPTGNLQFAEQIDDATFLYVDGAAVISDTVWNRPVASPVLSLTPNTWVDFELRIGNGSGGAGPTNNNDNGGSNWGGGVGFVYSTSGVDGGLDRNNYTAGAQNGRPVDPNLPSGPSLFRFQSGVGFADDIRVQGTGGVINLNAAALLNEVNQNRVRFEAAGATMTVNGLGKTLGTRVDGVQSGTDIEFSNGTLTINGDGNFRPVRFRDGSNTNVLLVKSGTGDLLLDNTSTSSPNDLDGTTFRVDQGRMVVTATDGINPIATVSTPIQLNGGTLAVGGVINSSTTFANALSVPNNSTLEHSTNSRDTLGTASNGIAITSGRTLTANISAGSLNVLGPVGGAGAVLSKQGAGTLLLDGAVTLGSAPTIGPNGGTLFLTNTSNSIPGPITVQSGSTLAIRPGAIGTNAVNLDSGALSIRGATTVGTSLVSGFGGDGTGYTLTGAVNAGEPFTPTVVSDVLTITRATNDTRGSAWKNDPVDLANGFVAQFTYVDRSGTNVADGFTFAFQNGASGDPGYLGGGGGAMGYGGAIPNSAALQFNIWDGSPANNGGPGIAYNVNGAIIFNAAAPNERAQSIAPVNLRSGNPITVTVGYSGGVLNAILSDEIAGTSARFTRNLNGDARGTLESTLGLTPGGTTALVGFTGATGGLNALQEISNFRMNVFNAAAAFENVGTDVSISGNSTVDASYNALGVQLGTLNAATGSTLNVTGATNLKFAGTTFASSGPYSVNVASNDTFLGPIAVTGGGPLTINKTGNGALAFNYNATDSLPAGSTVNVDGGNLKVVRDPANVNPFANTTVNVNQDPVTRQIGAFQVDATGGTIAPTGTINVNGGIIRASGGVADFTATTVNITPYNPGIIENVLAGKLFAGRVGLGLNNSSGVNNVNRQTQPSFEANLSQAFTFGPLFGADGNIASFFGTDTGPTGTTDAFTMVFTGEYTAPETGDHQFGFRNNDDGASFWIDLDQNGLFETNGANGNERIANEDNCCPNNGGGVSDFRLGNVSLVQGQRYKVFIGLQDTGGGSSLDAYIKRPSELDPILIDTTQDATTNDQFGLWRASIPSGGASAIVENGSELRFSSQTNFSEAVLSGSNAKLTFNATSTATNRLETLTTTGGGINNRFEVGTNNTVSLGVLTNAQNAVLTKEGEGTVIVDNQNLGTGSTLRVNGGILELNGTGSAVALDNTGTPTTQVNGAVEVLAGTARINGSISGSVTVQAGGTLAGSGTVGPVTINADGILAPGRGDSPISTLNTGDLVASTGADFALQIVSAAAFDRLNVNGVVDITGADLTLSLTGNLSILVNDLFFVLLNDGADAVNGTFNGLADGAIFTVGETRFQISYDANLATSSFDTGGNDIALRALDAIPEPGSLTALCGGLSFLLGLQRFRRRSRSTR
jgi:hypothetical protein